jgi:excisionase family DNA binding protein
VDHRAERLNVIRPAEHLVHGLDGPVALVDGRVCAMLNKLLGLDGIRAQVRGQDPQLDHTLLAIRIAAVAYTQSSSAGTVSAPREEPVSQSTSQLNDTLGTTEAASLLHMSRRAVSNECKQKRLPATLIGGRYRIHRDDLAAFMADRM